MRWAAPAAMVLLLAGGPLAGTSVSADEPNVIPFRAEDPTGDAYEFSPSTAYAEVLKACFGLAPPELLGTCLDGDQETRNSTGTPADPALDIVAFEVNERAATLELVLEVASLADGLQAAVNDEAGYGVRYGLFWQSDHGPWFGGLPSCFEGAFLDVHPRQNGYQVYGSQVGSFIECGEDPAPHEGRCSSGPDFLCFRGVDIQVEEGTPGRIIWTLPREMVPNTEQGRQFNPIIAFADRNGPHPDPYLQASFETKEGPRWVFHDVDSFWRVDAAWADPGPRLQLPVAAADIASGTVMWSTPDVEMPDADRLHPHMTLREGEFAETPSEFRYTLRFDDLQPDALPHGTYWGLLLPDGGRYWAGYNFFEGAFDTWIGRAGLENGTETWTALPVRFDVEFGSPATATWTLQRDVLPPMSAGDIVTGIMANQNPRLDGARSAGPAGDIYAYGRLVNHAYLNAMPPLRLLYDSEPFVSQEGTGLTFTDPIFDEEPPQGLDIHPGMGEYDLTEVRLHLAAKDRLHLEVDLRDLAQASVPMGYDAAFFGVGLRHAGSDWMVGFYKEPGKSGEFFCAADTTLFQAAPADPLTAPSRLLITGNVLPAGSGGGEDGGVGAGGGTIEIDAPLSCLGLTEEPILHLEDVVAGVYWIQHLTDPTGRPVDESQVAAVDQAQAEGPLEALEAPPDPIETESFWAEPFGVPQFWDISGVVLALGVAAISVGIFVRRRIVMKRYLVKLEDLADQYHNQPEAYGLSLVALRKRLYDDLLANRLSESHFVMVEERLRAALSSTRINSFGAAFYDLPPALMIRLQSLLADGRFSPHDHRVLSDLVGKLKIPSASRQDVRAQIAVWAKQDAEMAKMAKLRKRERRRHARAS